MDKNSVEKFQGEGHPVWFLGSWSDMPVKAAACKYKIIIQDPAPSVPLQSAVWPCGLSSLCIPKNGYKPLETVMVIYFTDGSSVTYSVAGCKMSFDN